MKKINILSFIFFIINEITALKNQYSSTELYSNNKISEDKNFIKKDNRKNNFDSNIFIDNKLKNEENKKNQAESIIHKQLNSTSINKVFDKVSKNIMKKYKKNSNYSKENENIDIDENIVKAVDENLNFKINKNNKFKCDKSNCELCCLGIKNKCGDRNECEKLQIFDKINSIIFMVFAFSLAVFFCYKVYKTSHYEQTEKDSISDIVMKDYINIFMKNPANLKKFKF